MKMSEPCILFAANPKAKAIKDVPEHSSALGSIYAHVAFLAKHGAVFWEVRQIGQNPELNRIKTGYIYNSSEKAINIKLDIEYIKTYEEICDEYGDSEDRYIPAWRDYLIKDDLYWIKITGISRLTKDYTASDFRKYKDGMRFKQEYKFRNSYNIAIEPDYPSEPYEINPQSMVDETIDGCINDGKYDEKDIEDIVEKRLLSQNLEYIDRQPPTRDGRIDIAYKDKSGVFYVIEIKKEADITALDQLKRYMNDVKRYMNDVKEKAMCKN